MQVFAFASEFQFQEGWETVILHVCDEMPIILWCELGLSLLFLNNFQNNRQYWK